MGLCPKRRRREGSGSTNKGTLGGRRSGRRVRSAPTAPYLSTLVVTVPADLIGAAERL
jgi:hypothetical protein